MNRYAVIVAGGSGSRMGSDTPKQFLPIGNAPILMHTIKRFFTSNEQVNIVLVLPEEQIERWHQLCEKYSFYGMGGDIIQNIKANTFFDSTQLLPPTTQAISPPVP